MNVQVCKRCGRGKNTSPTSRCLGKGLTQFEIPVQDFLLVKVLESRHNLPEVVSDFGLGQHLSGLQDVSHGLGGGEGEAVRQGGGTKAGAPGGAAG